MSTDNKRRLSFAHGGVRGSRTISPCTISRYSWGGSNSLCHNLWPFFCPSSWWTSEKDNNQWIRKIGRWARRYFLCDGGGPFLVSFWCQCFCFLRMSSQEERWWMADGEESSCATRPFYPMIPLCLIEMFLLSHLSLSFSVCERQEFVLFVR